MTFGATRWQLLPLSLLWGLLLALSGCVESTAPTGREKSSGNSLTEPPQWAKDVIWYQIFVERFRNGDSDNDPTPADMKGTYPGFVPEGWTLTPWTHEWYRPDPYFSELEGRSDQSGRKLENFGQKAQLRRYGGDLQGILDRLDYLETLGVTAIYFNPLNDAPSLHKYDARTWRHIDRNFGPTPREDGMLISQEDPADPSTWQWTGADRLFLTLLKELHDRGMRVILDYSWNHTGDQFWAFQDVRAKGSASPFADWYWIEEFDDPQTPENEFRYQGWFGVPQLPEIRETVRHDPSQGNRAYEGDLFSDTVKEHIFHVSRRWLDPDGDGDPSDGVDGFRLDVAAEIGLGFWRDYRRFVRSINPDAYLLGEVWWEEWPDKLLDPEPFVRGDVFDAVMNYRWYRAARHFFARAPDALPVSAFVENLESLGAHLRSQNNSAMMNLTASHDTPRVATSLFNKNKYKFQTSPSSESDYKIHRPDAPTFQTLRLLLAQQFTYIGAPHIWAGDEMGMWGADDPSTRKPLIWPDYQFESETAHPLGRKRPTDPVAFDQSLFDYYRRLVRIRKEHTVLVDGEIEFVVVDDANELLAYRRFVGDEEVLAVFNTAERRQTVQLPVRTDAQYRDLLANTRVSRVDPKTIAVELPPRTAAIIGRQ